MINAIDPNQLLTQLRALQNQVQGNMGVPAQTQPQAVEFSTLMKQAVTQVNGLQQSASELRTGFELGDPAVQLADVMIASQKASVAFEATVQVRNRFVEAYQEIMRMPI